MTAGGTLALNNVISTGANKVIANGSGGGAAGVTRSASGLVNGNLEKPVGTGRQRGPDVPGRHRQHLFARRPQVRERHGGRQVTAAAEHPNIATSGIRADKSVNRYWTLTPGGGLAFTNYSATFTFVASDVDAGANTGKFVVKRYDGTNWERPRRDPGRDQHAGHRRPSMIDFAVGEPDAAGPVTSTVAASPSPRRRRRRSRPR